ncbi:MAG: hypothetical protein PVJ67_03545 [Candidatus Pacearchaeota archaeon]|jgi:hypothetical protein
MISLESVGAFAQTYIGRNVEDSFSYTGDDKYFLYFNGNYYDLVYIGSGEYATKRDTFMKITKETSGNNTYDNYWLVKTKDGTNYRLGYNNNSELVSNLQDYAVRLSVDLIQDTYGNSIFYDSYEDESLLGSNIDSTSVKWNGFYSYAHYQITAQRIDNITVKDYIWPEPTYSIDSEQSQ